MITMVAALKKVIKIVGSQRLLAKKLGISHQRVNYWVNRDEKAPGEFCIPMELLVEGEVTRYDLRPDIFLTL